MSDPNLICSGNREIRPARLYSASQFAAALNCSKQAIRKHLSSAAPDGDVEIKGQRAQGWLIASLPQALRSSLAAIAEKRGHKTIEALLSDPPRPWTPPILFSDLPDAARTEAFQWRDVLADLLAHQHSIAPGELLATGLGLAKKIFSREISEATFRRHFDLAVTRDNGFENWQRMDLYVSESAYQAPAQPEVKTPALIAWPKLPDVLADLSNKKNPTLDERAFIFHSAFDRIEQLIETEPGLREARLKREFANLIFQSVPAIAKTESALRRSLDRKITQWRVGGKTVESITDRRPENSGAEGVPFCDQCANRLVSNAVAHDGNILAAHRLLYDRYPTGEGYCEDCYRGIFLDKRKNKSYLSASRRRQVKPIVLKLMDQRRSKTVVRAKSPSIMRTWSDVAPGDFLSSDDVCWNFPFRYEDGTGRIGRGECLLTADLRTDFIIDSMLIAGHFNQEHIRISILNACRKITGRPRFGFFFENSVYKSTTIDGLDSKYHPKWALTSWREVEQAFRKYGVRIGARNDFDFGLGDPSLGLEVRHTRPGNPRSKTIEGTIRRLQEIQRPIDNFLGFNEREYDAEHAQRNLRRARQFDPVALAKIPTISEWRDVLDQTIKEANSEIQNGNKLPGVSPLEAWQHGIDGHPGIATRPLPGLDLETQFRLATWQRKVVVKPEGVIISIGRRKYPYWGKEMEPYIYREVFARFNFEDPSILFCRSADSNNFFSLKLATAYSTFERHEVLAQLNQERAAILRAARVEFSKLEPPIKFSVIRANAGDPSTKDFAGFSAREYEQHREDQRKQDGTRRRITKLASALGAQVSANVSPARAAQQEEAARRLAERREHDSEIQGKEN
jgi:biotin operon repressor